MSFSIYRGSVDLSNYIISCGGVPYISKNQDSSITAKGFSFEISDVYGDANIESIAGVTVRYNGTHYYGGYVTKIRKNYKNHSYTIDISGYLGKLKDYNITYANLHIRMTGTPTYEASDSLTAPNMALLEVMEEMFDDAGLSLDIITNSMSAKTVVNAKTVLGANDGGVPQSEDFLFSDIRIDENMLYAINQPFATDYTVVQPDSYITYFDFISWICSYLNLVIDQDGGSEDFILDRTVSHGSYSIADNDTLYLDVNEQKIRGDYSISYRAGGRLDYQDTTEDPIDEIRSIGDGTALKSFGGLILLLIDQSFGSPSANDLYPMVYSVPNGTGFLTTEDKTTGNFYIGQRMREYYDKALTITTTITDPTLTYQDVLLNEFDLQNQTSKIKELS